VAGTARDQAGDGDFEPGLRTGLPGPRCAGAARGPGRHDVDPTISEDWQTWCDGAGVQLDLGKGLKCDTAYHAFELAAEGIGVAVGRRPLVNADLDSRRLVRLFPELDRRSTSYWLVCAEESMGRREVAAFRDWLVGSFVLEDA
jgi:DNA-binding transcriptional LysR family regulator